VVSDGDGDIVRITGETASRAPAPLTMDSYNWTVTDEHMLTYSFALRPLSI